METNKVHDISVVIPALNEEDVIRDTVRTTLGVLEKCELVGQSEVIIVNDGSTDKTREYATESGARVVSHPKAMGYGRALKDGIREAKHDTIIIFDADGTYPIEHIPEFIKQYNKGFDLVVGARTGKHYKQSIFKFFLRCFLKFLVEFATGTAIEDINSGMRIFSRKSVVTYFSHLCETFSFSTSQTLAYLLTHKAVLHIPIPYSERSGQTKVRLFRDSLRTLQFILFQVLYFNPFKIFLLMTLGMLALMVVSFTSLLFIQLNVLYISGIASFFFAILFFAIGLISEQLRQILVVGSSESSDD